jgi:hypothetical protein
MTAGTHVARAKNVDPSLQSVQTSGHSKQVASSASESRNGAETAKLAASVASEVCSEMAEMPESNKPATSHQADFDPVALSVSKTSCCAALRIGSRQLRSLVSEGRLALVGTGHSRRITVASLDSEIERRRNLAVQKSKSGNLHANAEIGNEALPNFSPARIDIPAVTPQNEPTMYHAIFNQQFADRINPIGELLPIARAAAAVGLSDRAMRELVEGGRLPSVLVSGRRRVNREVLRRWAQGELNQQQR